MATSRWFNEAQGAQTAMMLRGAAALALVVYPLIVYVLIEQTSPHLLVGLFGAFAMLRLLLVRELNRTWLWLGVLTVAALCVSSWFQGSVDAVRLYPALMSAAGAVFGIYTLRHPPSAIERLVKLINMPVTEARRPYLRGVTRVWVVFFMANGAFALYTAVAAPLSVWAFYNGFLSYVLVAALFTAEYLFRQWYAARHPDI